MCTSENSVLAKFVELHFGECQVSRIWRLVAPSLGQAPQKGIPISSGIMRPAAGNKAGEGLGHPGGAERALIEHDAESLYRASA
jgi:hypothetical protein